MTPEQCREHRERERRRRRRTGVRAHLRRHVHGAAVRPGQPAAPSRRRACIDQFEFPDMPCEYPVVWVKAREAAELCAAEGKRLCDAHEWEGACQGRLRAAGLPLRPRARREPERRRRAHARGAQPRPRRRQALELRPGLPQRRLRHRQPEDARLPGRRLERSAARTPIPTGRFPDCRSPLGVYDLNGNAAEHMNLPLDRVADGEPRQHRARRTRR